MELPFGRLNAGRCAARGLARLQSERRRRDIA
jgi:hypothetical protein